MADRLYDYITFAGVISASLGILLFYFQLRTLGFISMAFSLAAISIGLLQLAAQIRE